MHGGENWAEISIYLANKNFYNVFLSKFELIRMCLTLCKVYISFLSAPVQEYNLREDILRGFLAHNNWALLFILHKQQDYTGYFDPFTESILCFTDKDTQRAKPWLLKGLIAPRQPNKHWLCA